MANDVFPGAKLMQLVEWGYPMGRLRAVPDPALGFSVVHITANPFATAEDEAGWRQRDTALQNSATFFNNRNGAPVQTLGDPARMAPWANGDVNRPNMNNPRIARMVRDGVNANTRTLLALENCGNETQWTASNGRIMPGGYPITKAQEETNAKQIAYYHKKHNYPITRETVIGHWELNSVTRPNCPARDKAIVDRIVARARVIAYGSTAPSPTPTPKEEDMILLPVEVYPAGTTASFAKATTYDLYRIVKGVVERKQYKTPADRGSSAAAGAKLALNGDTAHAGIYLLNGAYAGWTVSGWGSLPTIKKPAATTGITETQAKAREKAAAAAVKNGAISGANTAAAKYGA